MKTGKMWLLFFGVKGMILLAPLSFFVVHYMVNSSSLSKKNDMDVFDANGLTPLMYAAQQIFTDGARKLIEDGADPDLLSKNLAPRYANPDGTQKINGSTALHMACANLDNEEARKIINMLVYNGANTRIKSLASGQTPLSVAALSSYTIDDRFPNLIELLVKNGADINATDNNFIDVDGGGNTILHNAVEQQRADWLEALLGKRFGALVDRGVKNKGGHTAYDLSKTVLKYETMTDIFDKYPVPPVYNPQEQDPNGLTGLMLAAIRGDEAYINKISNNDPVFDLQSLEKEGDQYGYTALHLALLQGRLTIVKLLLKKGATLEMRDKRGLPFFHRLFCLESLNDRKAVVDMISHRTSLNIQDSTGNTLLHHAVMQKDAEIIKYMLSKYSGTIGLSIANNNSETAADLARKIGSREVLVALGQMVAA